MKSNASKPGAIVAISLASLALSSLGSSLAEYMAGHITLTKTKDGYVTYDELLAELRKMFGVRK